MIMNINNTLFTKGDKHLHLQSRYLQKKSVYSTIVDNA